MNMLAGLLGLVAVVPLPCHTASTPKLWLPSEIGYTSRIKTFWFGANASGLDSEETLASMSRYAVAGYGWQTGHPGGGTPRTGEALQSAALSQARAHMDKVGNNKTMLFMYRQIQVALRLFEAEAEAADNASLASLWLRSSSTGQECLAKQPWGTKDPYWNFSVQQATDYWLERVIKPLTQEHSLQGGRGAIFFDEVDQGYCGYFNRDCGCEGASFSNADQQSASNKMLRLMVALLNGAGIVPILNLDNQMRDAASGTEGPPLPCTLPEDTLVTALQGLEWVRFYEIWPSTNWVFGKWQDSAQLHASMIQNAILEAEAGVPTVLHSGWFQGVECPAAQRNISRPGRVGGDLEFYIAAYLIVQSPGTTISFSSAWYDKDFCWRSEFDVEYGIPLDKAQRTSGYTWERQYTKARVKLDVSQSRQGSVYLLAQDNVDAIV